MKYTLCILSIILSLTIHAQMKNCAALVTDKPYYFVEDTIKGQAIVLKPCQQFNHPLEVTLLSPQGLPVLRQIIPYGADAYFNLPLKGMKSEGMYQLLLSYPKASHELLLQQDLAIIQPLLKEAESASTSTEANLYHYGLIVHGTKQQLVVQVANEQGIGVSADGMMVNSTGDTLHTFKTDRSGLANVFFVPDSAQSYRIHINGERSIRKELPTVVARGIMVKAQVQPQGVNLTILSNQKNRNYLVKLMGENQLKKEVSLTLTQDTTDVFLDFGLSSSGFLLIQVFKDSGEKVWHQLLHSSMFEKSWESRFQANLENGRSEISLTIKEPQQDQVYFCSVLDQNQMPLALYSPFQNPQWIQSFNPKDQSQLEDVSRHLAVWSNDTAILNRIQRSKPELESPDIGVKFRGRLVDEAGIGKRFVPVILTIPSLKDGLYTAVTSSSGVFTFKGLVFDEAKTGYVYPMIASSQEIEKIKIQTFDILDVVSSSNPLFLNFKHKIRPIIERQVLIQKINALYKDQTDTLAQATIMNINQLDSLYGEPDHVVNLKNYVTFNSVRQLIKEAVSDVNFVKGSIRVFSQQLRKNYDGNPLMLVDGIPSLSDSVILNLDPANISRVEVVSSRRKLMRMGSLGQFGILALYTTNGIDVEDMLGVQKVSLFGYHTRAASRLSNTAVLNKRTPELFTSIYWNPQVVNPAAPLKFRIPNSISNYKVRLGTFTSSGFQVIDKELDLTKTLNP